MKWKRSRAKAKEEEKKKARRRTGSVSGGSANSCADYTHISAKYTRTHTDTHTNAVIKARVMNV